MKKLTSRQEEYLFLFADRDGRGKGVSEAAEQFQVSKPTAFSISEALEKRGMIEKGNFGEIRLTEEGWSYIAPKLGYLNVLTEWLESDLGLAPVLAEQEARRMVVSLLPETVRAMAESRERRRTEGSFFVLCPQNIRYRPQKKFHLHGILEKMWYRTQGGWREAAAEEDGRRRIPGAAVRCRQTDEGTVGTVQIRARASVGMLGMPESEADIVFFLSRLEPDKETEGKK